MVLSLLKKLPWWFILSIITERLTWPEHCTKYSEYKNEAAIPTLKGVHSVAEW